MTAPEQRHLLSPYEECCRIHEVHLRSYSGQPEVHVFTSYYTATYLQKQTLYSMDAQKLAQLHSDLLTDGWLVLETTQGAATRTTIYHRTRVIY